jgi:diacylglycerol kinase (ATP)
MKNKRYRFIVNTTSGRGFSKKRLDYINDFCDSRQLNYDIKFTEYRKHASKIAEESIKEGIEKVISVGGDGTSHEIANALIDSDAEMGIIPCGSGNDFPKSVKIPLNLVDSLDTIINNYVKAVDVGVLNDKYFINGIGFGLDGAVSHRFSRYRLIRGEFGYIWGAVLEALAFKGFKGEISIPGWSYRGKILLAGASNGAFHGGKFQLAPSAVVDDGLLEVYIIKNMSRLARLIQMPKVLNGKHQFLEDVYIKRAPSLNVTIEHPVKAHMDGEPFILEPGYHNIYLKSRALKVICRK